MRAVFPGVNIHGCLFHYTQAIYRKVCEFGLVNAYNGVSTRRRVVIRYVRIVRYAGAHTEDLEKQ